MEEAYEFIKRLNGLNYKEWVSLKTIIDALFNKMFENQMEKTNLEFSKEDLKEILQNEK